MKKVRLLWMLSAAMLLLAACGSGGNSGNDGNGEPAATEQSQQETTKITYWTGSRHDEQYIREVIERYNAENEDGIEVEMQVFSENYDQSVDIAFTSNQAPDVVQVNPSSFQSFQKKGYFEPLDDYAGEEFKNKFAPAFLEGANIVDGVIYSFPNYGNTVRLIYNVDLFEKAGIAEPPRTLQELVETARKLTEAGKEDNAYGFAINMKSPASAFVRSTRGMTEAMGYGGTGYDFKTGAYDFAGQKEVFEALRQMREEGSMLPGSESLDIDPLRAQFAEGKIGMYFSISAEISVYQEQFPAKIRWAAAVPPTADGQYNGTVGVLNVGGWLAMSSKTAHKEEAWKFIEYMYNDQVLKEYHEKGYGLSVVPSVLASAAKPEIKEGEGFLPTQYDAVWPIAPTITVEGLNYNDAFAQYIINGGDIDAVIADLNDRYNEALNKAKESGAVVAEPMPDFDPKSLQGTLAQ